MRVVTGVPGRWLPAVLRMSAVTFSPMVCFANGKFQAGTPRGLALIAHEAFHIRQGRELGRLQFYMRYFRGQLRSGFRHARHPMEIPAITLQRMVFATLDAAAGQQPQPPVG
jgi:hypothetical protein